MPVVNRARPRHRLRRSRWRIVLLLAGLILALLVSSVAALAVYGERSIKLEEVTGRATELGRTVTFPDGETAETLNVLLVGSDDREHLSEEEAAEFGGDTGGRRSDTLMVAQIEVGGTGAALLSFPRDLRVELCNGDVDKINAAMVAGQRSGTGAESCLVQTVSEHTGIAIDHYVEIDFAGFLGVIDALGGVTMYLEEPMIDQKANLNVPAGCVTLTPEQALGFVRSRGYDDDFGRIARQQRFVREVLDQITEVGTLANPARLVTLVNRAADAVRTDEDLGLTEMRDIAGGLRGIGSGGVTAFTVPSETAEIDGVSFVVELEEEAEALYSSFRDGSILRPEPEPTATPTPTPTPEPTVPPVTVLNATQVTGLAAAAGARLEAAGLAVGVVGDTERPDLVGVEIAHAPGLEAAAARVAASMPDASVREDAEVEGVVVLLGAEVTVESLQVPPESPAPTPPAAATPTTPGPTPSASPATLATPAPTASAAPGATAPAPSVSATPTPAVPASPAATTEPTSRNAAPVDVDC